MKKIFTLVAAALCAMNMAAKDYTGTLSVSVNETDPVVMNNQNISVEKQADGKYHLSIKNFKFGAISVGTIDVKDMEAINGGGFEAINYTNPITISKNEDGSPAMMAGQTMNMDFGGAINDNLLHMEISIDAKALGQVIEVTFQSNGTQIPNSDFEEFHTASVSMMGGEPATSDEPNNWHSFMSASGNPVLVYLAGYNPHTFISDDVRPGSAGKKSVKLLGIDMGVAIANGTITTGRMNTGSAEEPANTDLNYAWMDMSETEKDANGDPFYAALVSKPDSMKVWLKFKQGTPNPEHPYATVTGVITDGTRINEPEDSKTTYTNIVGEARNAKIAETNGEWKEFTIPFEYEKFAANNAQPKAILATISTNADPAQGSNNDELYVDDLSLVYNHGLKSLTYKGENIDMTKSTDSDYEGEGMVHNKTNGETVSLNDFVVEADGAGAYVTKMFRYDDDWAQWELHVYVTAADLSESSEYCITFINPIKPDTTTGINNAAITLPNGVKAIYNMAGQQVQTMQAGQVYVVKYNNGETKKMIKK